MTMTDFAPRAATLLLIALLLAGCCGGAGAPGTLDPVPLAAGIDGPGPAGPRPGLPVAVGHGVRIHDDLATDRPRDLAALRSVATGLGAPEPLLMAYATAAP